jgi:hypothetical protein
MSNFAGGDITVSFRGRCNCFEIKKYLVKLLLLVNMREGAGKK